MALTGGGTVALDVTLARLGRAGTHVYVTELARALAPQLGERLRLIASRFAALVGSGRRLTERLNTLGRDLWWHQFGVARAARSAGARVLHLPGALGPVRHPLPMVVTIHDLTVLRFPQFFRPWFRQYAGFVQPRLARHADAIIAVSHATKADLVDAFAIPEERVTVIGHGIDPVFSPVSKGDQRAAAVRRRYGLTEDFVLTVGSLEPRKNLNRLIAAIEQLRRQPAYADIELVHAGPHGWLMNGMPRSERVRLIGHVPQADLAVLYSTARVCAYPSLYEGFGLPVLEAMACGCPVVTSNVSSLPEVSGDAAVLVDPRSVDAIADGIGELWTNESLRRDLAARGRARAKDYTWDRTARQTAAVYASVMS